MRAAAQARAAMSQELVSRMALQPIIVSGLRKPCTALQYERRAHIRRLKGPRRAAQANQAGKHQWHAARVRLASREPQLTPRAQRSRVLVGRQVVERDLERLVVAGKARVLRPRARRVAAPAPDRLQRTGQGRLRRTSRLGTRNLASSAVSGIRLATQPTSNSASCASTSALRGGASARRRVRGGARGRAAGPRTAAWISPPRWCAPRQSALRARAPRSPPAADTAARSSGPAAATHPHTPASSAGRGWPCRRGPPASSPRARSSSPRPPPSWTARSRR